MSMEVFGSNPNKETIVLKNPLWIGDSRRGMKRVVRIITLTATVGSIPTSTTNVEIFLKIFIELFKFS